MHNVHNEYILLLCEAAEFERDMRTILLPGLLEHQQAIHEDSTDRWKMIMQDIYRYVIDIRIFLNFDKYLFSKQ